MELVFHGCSISMIRHFTRKNEFYGLISIACDACLTNPKHKKCNCLCILFESQFFVWNLTCYKKSKHVVFSHQIALKWFEGKYEFLNFQQKKRVHNNLTRNTLDSNGTWNSISKINNLVSQKLSILRIDRKRFQKMILLLVLFMWT